MLSGDAANTNSKVFDLDMEWTYNLGHTRDEHATTTEAVRLKLYVTNKLNIRYNKCMCECLKATCFILCNLFLAWLIRMFN